MDTEMEMFEFFQQILFQTHQHETHYYGLALLWKLYLQNI